MEVNLSFHWVLLGQLPLHFAVPKLIAVFITEMVILHKDFFIVIVIIIS